MNKMHAFIEKYLAKFLTECQIRSPFIKNEQNAPIPPTGAEVEELMSYLLQEDVDPVIIGSLAVVKHLKITDQDIKTGLYRPIHALEFSVSRYPSALPEGWKIHNTSSEKAVWISPGGGYVFFSVAASSNSSENLSKIDKDPESVLMGCPVADVRTLFKMKLSSHNEKDLYDLMCLARRMGPRKAKYSSFK